MFNALTRLARQPLYVLSHVSLITLALLISTSGASVVDSLLLRPLPFDRPFELAALNNPQEPGRRLNWSDLESEAARVSESSSIVNSATVRWGFLTQIQGSVPGKIDLVHYEVSDGFWNLLGVRPYLGRLFESAEASSGIPPAIVGDTLWRVHLDGRHTAIGDVLTINGFRVRVVGVMPREFAFPVGANIWTPLASVPRRPPSFVRVRQGTSIGQLAAEFPRLEVYGLDRLVRPEGRIGVLLIGLSAFLVLMIAAVQLVSLNLAHGVAQTTPIWIRKALGASDRRLLNDSLWEAAALSSVGVGIALLTLPVLLDAIEHLLPRDFTRGQSLVLDIRTFTVTALSATAIVAAAVGVSMRLSSWVALSGANVSVIGLREIKEITGGVLMLQFACTSALIYLSFMGLQTFRNVSATDLGFDADSLLLARLAGTATGGQAAFAEAANRVDLRLSADPSVLGIARASIFPLSTGSFTGTAQVPRVPEIGEFTSRVTFVSSGYFGVIGARFVEGGGFPERYDQGAVVINEEFARSLRQHGSVVGQVVQVTSFRGAVLGVVADMVDRSPDIPSEPHAYFMDPGWLGQTFFVKVADNSSGRLERLVAEIIKHETGAADVSVVPMSAYVRRATAPQRIRLWILMTLCAIAAGLAWAGVSVSLLMNVRQRGKEIGLLFALGADTGDVMRLIARTYTRAAAIGAGSGLLAAGGLVHLLRSVFFGVPTVSVAAVALTLGALVLIAVLASIFPVTQVARMAPSEAFRR